MIHQGENTMWPVPNASSHMPKSTVKKQLHKLKKKLNADLHIKTQVPTHELHFPTYTISIFHQFSSVYLILSFSWIKLLYPNFRSLPWAGFFIIYLESRTEYLLSVGSPASKKREWESWLGWAMQTQFLLPNSGWWNRDVIIKNFPACKGKFRNK